MKLMCSLVSLALCLGLSLGQDGDFANFAMCNNETDLIYDFEIDGIEPEEIKLADYEGKIFIIFNSAVYSEQVYTDQYLAYNELIAEFGEEDFSAIAIPTNQFGMEEPGLNREILNEMRYVRPGNDFVPNFAVAERSEANGLNADDIFDYLKDSCPSPKREILAETSKIYWSPTNQNDITWNFEKFLINHEGRPYKRYVPEVSPDSDEIREDIQFLVEQKNAKKREKVVRQRHLPKKH